MSRPVRFRRRAPRGESKRRSIVSVVRGRNGRVFLFQFGFDPVKGCADEGAGLRCGEAELGGVLDEASARGAVEVAVAQLPVNEGGEDLAPARHAAAALRSAEGKHDVASRPDVTPGARRQPGLSRARRRILFGSHHQFPSFAEL